MAHRRAKDSDGGIFVTKVWEILLCQVQTYSLSSNTQPMSPQLFVRTIKHSSNLPMIVMGRSAWVAEWNPRIRNSVEREHLCLLSSSNHKIEWLPISQIRCPLTFIFTCWTIHMVIWHGKRFYSIRNCVIPLWVTESLIKLVFSYLVLTSHMFNHSIVHDQQLASRGGYGCVFVF